MRVESLLEHAAERTPAKTALVCSGERRSYAQLNEDASRISQALIGSGIEPGDRVVVNLGNSIEAVATLFGVLKAGGVFVMVHPQSRPGHLARISADCGARLVVSDVEFRRLHAGGDGSLEARIDRVDADLAALVYTSGSTGKPKGVMLTHRNITSAAASICAYLDLSADDVIVNALPLAFTYGLGQITTAFLAGATVVLESSMTYPRVVLESMLREGVTGLPLVPTMATLLLQGGVGGCRFPRLRYITNAGAPLTAAKMQKLREALPGVRIYSMYGQTECQRISYLPPDQLDARPASVGIPIPGTSAWVVDERGEPAAPGVVGELLVSGPHVMQGYWNQPDATREVLTTESTADRVVLRTGDLFRADAEGYLYFVSRSDDVIKTRGEKVAPCVVEDAIAALPGVAEVVAFGVPDDLLGEAIAVTVTLKAGALLSVEQIRRHCRLHLEAFMAPKFVAIRAALPTTMTGKINRRELRETALGLGEAWA